MKKTLFLLFVVYLVALIPHAGAAMDDNGPNGDKPRGSYDEGTAPSEEVPPGMEMRDIGNIHMIAPQGLRIQKKGSQMIMEGIDEFTVRNLQEMNARLEKIEADQKNLKKTVEDLKLEISDERKE